MRKKAILIFLLLSIILLNISAAEYSEPKTVVFYSGPEKRIFGFSSNVVKSVVEEVITIGDSYIEQASGGGTTGTIGEVTFVLNSESTKAETPSFYFYWKLFTPKATTITISNAMPLTALDSSVQIHWYNAVYINDVSGTSPVQMELKTNGFTPIVIYKNTGLTRPEAGSQEFRLKIDNDSLALIGNGAGTEYTGSMVITVEGE